MSVWRWRSRYEGGVILGVEDLLDVPVSDGRSREVPFQSWEDEKFYMRPLAPRHPVP